LLPNRNRVAAALPEKMDAFEVMPRKDLESVDA
jgi:hypothetical protein